jgi:hypothetical protein
MNGERGEHIDAAHVSVGRSAVRMVDADEATLERAAVQRLRAGHATFTSSNVGIATFERGTISQSNVGIISGGSVACEDVRTLILASPVVRGDVHTLVDLRTAFALGLGMAMGKALLSLLGKVSPTR